MENTFSPKPTKHRQTQCCLVSSGEARRLSHNNFGREPAFLIRIHFLVHMCRKLWARAQWQWQHQQQQCRVLCWPGVDDMATDRRWLACWGVGCWMVESECVATRLNGNGRGGVLRREWGANWIVNRIGCLCGKHRPFHCVRVQIYICDFEWVLANVFFRVGSELTTVAC